MEVKENEKRKTNVRTPRSNKQQTWLGIIYLMATSHINDSLVCVSVYDGWNRLSIVNKEIKEVVLMKCQNCGKEHQQTDSNCCWIECNCDKTICGMCGYAGEEWLVCLDGNEEDVYWCCRKCPECGLEGCRLCI